MIRILYSKYNNTRRPEFATRTSIIEESNGKNVVRFVLKSAIFPVGREHISNLSEKCEWVSRLYKNAWILPVFVSKKGARFPFLDGVSISEEIEKHLDDMPTAIEKLNEFMDLVGDYSEDALVDFSMSDGFREVFGDCGDYTGRAAIGANIDELPDNFIRSKEGLYLVDYEWSFDFAIPIRFIRFRTAYYFFVKHRSIIHRASPQAYDPESDGGEAWFLSRFGFHSEEISRWKKIEDHFQDYVHGKGRKYMYNVNYQKPVRDINEFLNAVPNVAGDYDMLISDVRRLKIQLFPRNYAKYFVKYMKNRLLGKGDEI